MLEIKKILFPTDFSQNAQNAFRHCLKMADIWKAEIEVLHVVFPEYEGLDLPVLAASATNDKVAVAREMVKNFSSSGLHEVTDLKAIPALQHSVEIGTPASTICNIARRDQADLIIMGTKGKHDRLEKLFGSVTSGAIKKAPCPVLVVPENAPYEDLSILAYATDLDAADPYHLWQVGKLFEQFSPILHCVHVNVSDTISEVVEFTDLPRFFEKHAPALKIDFHPLPKQPIVDGLLSFVEDHAVSLLIMYAHQHSLIEQLFRQSQTRKMAFHTQVPLLVMKD